jgi:hypothetical protein
LKEHNSKRRKNLRIICKSENQEKFQIIVEVVFFSQMKFSISIIVLGIIIISYYLSFDYILHNKSAIAQLQSSQLPPATSGEGNQKSATAQPSPPDSQLPSQTNIETEGQQQQQQTTSKDLIVAAVGDSKAENEAKITFTNIKNENPDTFVFLGDASYIDDNGKIWTDLIDSVGLREIIQITRGNHEDQEENSEKAGEDMEEWMPSLKEPKNGVT